jgi:cytochrome c-type biogenesis protein CcmH
MMVAMRAVILVLLCCSLWSVSNTWAVIETYDFSSPDLERRYHVLSQELRCPKCQNQNIADSNAPIARDLRVVLFEQLEAGASDDEILAFMVARYGEFVRYRPGMDRNTVLLWAAPGLLLALGAMGLFIHFRQRSAEVSMALTDSDKAEIERLLREPRV